MGFITQKYFGGICTLIIQMRCLLNALQLWHKCCQHVHMFQAWPNISHAHKQLYLKVIHKRARLGCLALGSLPNPWRLQQENLISSLVGCALVPAGAWRSKGNWKWSQRRCCLLGDVPIRTLWTGASPGQLSCTSCKPRTGRTFPSGVCHHCAQHSPWKGSCGSHQHRYLFCRTHMPMTGTGNSLVLPLEHGWKRDKAIPALHLPPWTQVVSRYFFTWHRNGLNLTSAQVLQGVKDLTRPQILSRWG